MFEFLIKLAVLIRKEEMKSICSFIYIILGLWFLSSFPVSAVEKQSVDLNTLGIVLDKSSIEPTAPKELKLAEAIEKGIKNNLDLLQQNMNLRSNELNYEDARDRMYSPSIYLGVNSSYGTKFGHVHGPTNYTSYNMQNKTEQSLQLSLGEYTIYNFGRDKLVFDQAKLDWIRAKEFYEESKRSVKFQIIIAFWTLKSDTDKMESYGRSVKIAESILDLQKSRLPLEKATEADVSSSFVDLMNVKNLRDTAESSVTAATLNLNVLLGDPTGTTYVINEEISFLPIKVTEKILYESYLQQSPNIKNARKDFVKAQMNLELSEKNLLPLPTIKFSGINLYYTPQYYSSSQTLNPSGSNTNLNISSSIGLTIPLTGPGGLFGSRIIEGAEIQVSLSNLALRNTANRDLQTILQTVRNIRQFETTIENNRQLYTSSVSVLESVLKKFMSDNSVSRLEIRDALAQARDSEIELSNAVLSHLTNKTQLASFIGVDYLPRME
jgi:outer membrane protein TolC